MLPLCLMAHDYLPAAAEASPSDGGTMSFPRPTARLRTQPPHRHEPSGALRGARSLDAAEQARGSVRCRRSQGCCAPGLSAHARQNTSDRPAPACPLSLRSERFCPSAACARNVHRGRTRSPVGTPARGMPSAPQETCRARADIRCTGDSRGRSPPAPEAARRAMLPYRMLPWSAAKRNLARPHRRHGRLSRTLRIGIGKRVTQCPPAGSGWPWMISSRAMPVCGREDRASVAGLTVR